MADLVTSVFTDENAAKNAITTLKDKGYADVSVVVKDTEGKAAEALKDTADLSGAATGALAGTIVGGLAGLLTGAASFLIPGLGLLVLGPLAATLTGLGAGALTGGIVGALVDAGVPDEKAKVYEKSIEEGGVLLIVPAEQGNASEVEQLLSDAGGTDIHTATK